MNIKTRDFGIIQIEADSVYSFPQGVYGFEDADSFAVFMHEEDDVAFVYLQSVHAETPCFLVFSPFDMLPGYEPDMSKDDLSLLGVASEKDLIFLAIATVHPDARKLSINIKSPVALNPLRMTGRQVILQNNDYPVRYYPFLDAGAPPAGAPEQTKAPAARGEG
ncbi:MAG: flagellar assembly protein FliW [Clostridiales Family XIII bacterium]|jgi:flagellar assembly factor FliW|nr:flagellar assembly protein FliW [Clostridiales Family XIII bacterium]